MDRYLLNVVEPTIEQALELEELAFVGEKQMDRAELELIRNNGVLTGLTQDGLLVASAQIVTLKASGFEEALIAELDRDEAYLAGLCVRPGYQTQGIGNYLFELLLEQVRQLGCQLATATARIENIPSLRIMLKSDMNIVAYDPSYYEGKRGGRLILRGRAEYRKEALASVCSVLIRPGVDPDLQARDELVEYLGSGLIGHAIKGVSEGYRIQMARPLP